MSQFAQLSKELPNLKRNLTRAKNSGDPRKVVIAADAALKRFEEIGWPDCWSDFQRARDDAQIEICYIQREEMFS